jgi:hypothetical protein
MPFSAVRRHRLGLLLGVFLCGAILAIVAISSVDEAHRAPSKPGVMGVHSGVDPDNPLPGGNTAETTFAQAERSAPFEVLWPSTKQASSDTLTDVWSRTDWEPGVAMRYASGVEVIELVADPLSYPTDEFFAKLGDGLPGAHVSMINDAPSLVIESVPDQDNPPAVETILQGIHVTVYGLEGQTIDDVIAVAESLPATGPGKPGTSSDSPPNSDSE